MCEGAVLNLLLCPCTATDLSGLSNPLHNGGVVADIVLCTLDPASNSCMCTHSSILLHNLHVVQNIKYIIILEC